MAARPVHPLRDDAPGSRAHRVDPGLRRGSQSVGPPASVRAAHARVVRPAGPGRAITDRLLRPRLAGVALDRVGRRRGWSPRSSGTISATGPREQAVGHCSSATGSRATTRSATSARGAVLREARRQDRLHRPLRGRPPRYLRVDRRPLAHALVAVLRLERRRRDRLGHERRHFISYYLGDAAASALSQYGLYAAGGAILLSGLGLLLVRWIERRVSRSETPSQAPEARRRTEHARISDSPMPPTRSEPL